MLGGCRWESGRRLQSPTAGRSGRRSQPRKDYPAHVGPLVPSRSDPGCGGHLQKLAFTQVGDERIDDAALLERRQAVALPGCPPDRCTIHFRAVQRCEAHVPAVELEQRNGSPLMLIEDQCSLTTSQEAKPPSHYVGVLEHRYPYAEAGFVAKPGLNLSRFGRAQL